jgi:hypothetical protein
MAPVNGEQRFNQSKGTEKILMATAGIADTAGIRTWGIMRQFFCDQI